MRRVLGAFWFDVGSIARVADKHLNNLGDIHGGRWLSAMDRWAQIHSSTIARIRKEIDGTPTYALSDGACILKTYADMILDDEGEGN